MAKFYAPVTVHNYSFVLPFERDFSPSDATRWLKEVWHTSFYLSAVYLVLVFGIKRLMRDRKPFSLNGPLFLWNTILSIYSIVSFYRTAPEFWHTMSNYGLYHSTCVPSNLVDDTVSSFWTFLFVLSKLPEFGDTMFIVLRKQPLIFLHWYHHILTLLYGWYAYKETTSNSRWYMVMNSFIHTLMYSYYAFKAKKFRIPKPIAVVITSLQIVQMAAGCYVNYKAWQYKTSGLPCGISDENMIASSLLYFSYFVLFIRFFIVSYFGTSKRTKVTKTQ